MGGRLWSPPFAITLLVSTMISIGHYMLMTVLPGYAVRLGGGPQSAGLIMGVYSFSALVARPVSGYFMDTIGRRAVMTTGGLLFLAGTLALNWADQTSLLIVIRAVQGIGFSAISSAVSVVLADLSPPERLSEGLGWSQMCNSLTLAVGPFLSLTVVASAGFAFFFPMTAVVIGTGAGLTLLVVYSGNRPAAIRSAAGRQTAGNSPVGGSSLAQGAVPARRARPASRVSPGVFSIASVTLLMAFGLGTVFSFVTIHGTSLGLKATSMFFPVYALASIVTVRSLSGNAVRLFGPSRLMGAGLVAITCAFLSLGLAASGAPFLLAALLLGSGSGISFTMGNTILMSSASPENRGLSSAILFASMDIGIGTGSMLGGLVAVRLGYGGMFLAASCTAVAALVALFLRTRRHPE